MKITIHQGDVLTGLQALTDNSVHCAVTSPPYWGLRDYGVAGQLGLEKTPEEYLEKMLVIFREVRRVLRPDGTLWLNMSDSYCGSGGAGGDYNEGGLKAGQPKFPGRGSKGIRGGRPLHAAGVLENSYPIDQPNRYPLPGLKAKDLCGMPWRLALALQADGWWLRRDIIWAKPNPMPESCTDRPATAHEYIFLLTKSANYFYDAEAVKEERSNNSHGGAPLYGGSPKQEALGQQQGGCLGIPANRKPFISKNRKELRSDIESRHRSIIPGGQSMQAEPNGSRNLRSVWSVYDEFVLLQWLLEKYPEVATEMLSIFSESNSHLKDFWTMATAPFPQAHFATFPPALPEKCIKAGTSEHGCCPKCGAPWRRVVEKGSRRSWHDHQNDLARGQRDDSNEFKGINFYKNYRPGQSVGWLSTCSCDAGEPSPATVLDPFGGALTTALVAAKLGRDAVTIELNPDYVAMGVKRLKSGLGMLAEIELLPLT